MSTNEQDPTSEHETSPEDDWGDAVHLVRDDTGGSTVLPTKRESREKTVVTVIQSEREGQARSPDEQPEDPSQDEEQQPVVTKLNVREFSGKGGTSNKGWRPFRRDVEKLAKGDKKSRKSLKERWEIEKTEWQGAQTFKVRWIVGISIGLIVLLAGSLALLPYINKANDIPEQAVVLRAEKLYAAERVQVAESLMESRLDAVSIFNVYLSTSVADDLLPFIRDREEVEPLLRSAELPGVQGLTWTSNPQADWSILMVNGWPCALLSGVLSNFEDFTAYFVWENDMLLLDWEATTGYGTATFDELRDGQGDASEIRGVLSPSVFYTAAYPEEDYQSYQLVEPLGDRAVWCYVKRKTPLETMIHMMFVGGGIIRQQVEPTKVTIKLSRGTEGAMSNQWLIEELLHEQWVRF